MTPTSLRELDWSAARDRIDLPALFAALLGRPPDGRRGDRSDRIFYLCPFHPDENASLLVGDSTWNCFGCPAGGDAMKLVMEHERIAFPDALRLLAELQPAAFGWPSAAARPDRRATRPRPARATPTERPAPEPPDDWKDQAAAFVADCADRLWSPAGDGALAYLRNLRLLADATIRAAWLGFNPTSRPGWPAGVTIPWFGPAGRPRFVSVRRLDSGEPKYLAVAGGRRGGLYPGPAAIRPSRPAVIVEGEFDALLLGQALGDRAGVVTLGPAGQRPAEADREALWPALGVYAAHDTDEAGEAAAGNFPATARVRPPAPFKDWTEAATGPPGTRGCGVDLARYWSDVFAGDRRPPAFNVEELMAWRWGPGLDDPAPGLCVPRAHPDRLMAALTTPTTDPDDLAEAEAIRADRSTPSPDRD